MPDLSGVEIMALGTWNGTRIDEQKFDEVIEAFEATKDFARPHLKLGHNDEQRLIAKDGLPSAGEVAKVYKRGKKLLADFVNIPDKIFELIQRKRYKSVSVELFSGYRFKEKTFPTLLGAVALLGADLPAMATLNDILGTFAKTFTNEDNGDTIKTLITFERNNNEENMADNNNEARVAELEAQIAEQKKQLEDMGAKVSSFKADKDAMSKQMDDHKQNYDRKLAELEADRDRAEVEKFTLSLEKNDLLAPSMKPYVEALLSDGARKEFSVGDKKLSVGDLLGEMLKLAKDVYKINTKENTENAAPKDEDNVTELDSKIRARMADNKESYGVAYKHVMRNQ